MFWRTLGMIDISASLTDAEVASPTFKHSARLVNHSHIVRERSPPGGMGAAPCLAARLVFALLLLRAFPRPGAPTAAFRDPLLRALTRTGLSFCLARPVDQRSSLGTSTPYPLHYLTLLFES